ncbi:TPA: serine protease [Enterococcus faecium]
MKIIENLLLVVLISLSLISGYSVSASEIRNDYAQQTSNSVDQLNYSPKGKNPYERSQDFTEYIKKQTGNNNITFKGFQTPKGFSKEAIDPQLFVEDNRIKADPTKSPYKQCGYLEMYFFTGTSTFVKQGTGALIDKDRFLTAGSMLYSHDHDFEGWATASLIWVASQDGKGTLTEDPSSGQNGGTNFHSMYGWTAQEDSRYDMGYIVMNSSLEQLAGKLGYIIPDAGAVNSNVVSYTGNAFSQIMWGNETVAINTPEYIFHDVTISEGSIGAPVIQNGNIVGITTTLEKQGSMNQALAVRQEILSFLQGQ